MGNTANQKIRFLITDVTSCGSCPAGGIVVRAVPRSAVSWSKSAHVKGPGKAGTQYLPVQAESRQTSRSRYSTFVRRSRRTDCVIVFACVMTSVCGQALLGGAFPTSLFEAERSKVLLFRYCKDVLCSVKTLFRSGTSLVQCAPDEYRSSRAAKLSTTVLIYRCFRFLRQRGVEGSLPLAVTRRVPPSLPQYPPLHPLIRLVLIALRRLLLLLFLPSLQHLINLHLLHRIYTINEPDPIPVDIHTSLPPTSIDDGESQSRRQRLHVSASSHGAEGRSRARLTHPFWNDDRHKTGHHDTTVHENVAPAVVNETVKKTRHDEIQTAVGETRRRAPSEAAGWTLDNEG